MAKRRSIALTYTYNDDWIGGTYYIQNLIACLSYVEDRRKPALVIVTEDNKYFEELKKITSYPYLYKWSKVKRMNLFFRLINKAGRSLIGKNIFNTVNDESEIDILFPSVNPHLPQVKKILYWIPDFQEHHLPDLFSKEEIEQRKIYQQLVLEQGKFIVFSSRPVQKDFNEIYPSNKLKQFILPFAVIHPKLEDESPVVNKYQLPEKYFICCNQFWRHKDHATVLKAVSQLIKTGKSVFVVFTGKEYDYRSPDYFNELRRLVDLLGVQDSVKFTGFIPRNEQLILMKKAQAVLQPSLFEGWSTVVEDAKALNIEIIASGLEVHKEQLKTYKNCKMFPAGDVDQLVNCMLDTMLNGDNTPKPAYSYLQEVRIFGTTFIDIVDSICQ